MKTFDLPSNSNYGDQPIPIAFPDNWDVHISKIHGYDTPALTEAQIAEKIHAAIGAKPISEGAAGKKSAVIIIDDITRPTPCEPIAKAVIAELRAAGVACEIYPDAAKMKKQMAYANATAVPYVAMVGENEMAEGKMALKNMATGEQVTVTPAEAAAIIR